MNDSAMKPIQDLFPALLRKQPQKQMPVEEIVRVAWNHLAGPQIAARSVVFRVHQETLVVHVPDRMWQRTLHRLERKLLGRINDFLGRTLLRSIEFRVDANLAVPAPSASAAPPRKGPARELAPTAEAELEASANKIADPELRELFVRASRKMMR